MRLVLGLAAGSILWGTAMAISFLVDLQIWLDGYTANRTALSVLYFLGGLAGYPIAFLAARRLASDKPAGARFSASLLCLTVATTGLTALFFAASLQYTNGHVSLGAIGWHWPIYIATSGIAAVFQFLVIGARYFFPIGILFLAVASVITAKALR